MKQVVIIICLLSVIVMVPPPAQAESDNPFGFEIQPHPLQYEYCKPIPPESFGGMPHWYKCSSAPRPHPYLQEYLLFFVDEVGLCTILARSWGFRTHKDQLETVVRAFNRQISKTYGPPTSQSDSDSEYRYDWQPKDGFVGRGDVNSILLNTHSPKDGLGPRVELLFILVTAPVCTKQIDQNGYRAF